MKLVPEFKSAWRWISVQLMVVAGAIQAAWVFIPDDMKESFPKDYLQVVTIVLLVLGVAGRVTKQTLPTDPKDQG